MADYKVIKVSSQPPRDWSFNDKKTNQPVPMQTYKVMVEGENDPIDVNRKPGNPPTVGEVLSGTLELTEFGKRFKAAPKQNQAFSGKDQEAIRAQWAIGQAVSVYGDRAGHAADWMVQVEDTAKLLYAMVDRVKAPATGYEKAKAAAEAIKTKQTFSDGSPVPGDQEIVVTDFDPDEPINLNDIPF